MALLGSREWFCEEHGKYTTRDPERPRNNSETKVWCCRALRAWLFVLRFTYCRRSEPAIA